MTALLRPWTTVPSLILALACAATASAGARLLEGGLPRRSESPPVAGPRRPVLPPPAVEWSRYQARLRSGPAEALARPKALGDRLVLGLDDDLLPDYLATARPIDGEYEARLDVSGGPAGADDWIAVRFPARDLAGGLPVRVNDVILGLDDLNGATTWPAIELWLENPAEPLVPRSGAGSLAAPPLDAVAAGLEPAPPGAFEPTAFARLRAGFPSGLDVPADWLGDGAFDDDFDRFDQPLDDLAGLWLECEGDSCCESGGCPFTRTMEIAGMELIRGVGAADPTLAIRFPDPAVEEIRPAVDLDVRVSVMVDVSDPMAGPAGLALRALATDAYYAVAIDPAPNPDELVALVVTPTMGVLELGRDRLPFDGGSHLLEVEALGVNPSVSLAVFVDGLARGPFVDDVYRWDGTFAGLVATAGGSSGERWEDFRVERRRDVFVALQLPEGEDAGLPLDISESSVAWGAVSSSADGASWSPRTVLDPAHCFNPGNPFVQLEVEEIHPDGRLFTREARVVRVELDCPTCPVTRNRCNENGAETERFPPLPTVGEQLSVRVGWWNEHLADDRVLFRTSILDADCDSSGNLVASATFVAGDSAGQAAVGALVESVAGVMDFTPLAEGSYCLVLEELHDANADCCADGEEASGPFDDPLGVGACPGSCSPAPASDSNPSTGLLVRDFQVFRSCTPSATESDMDGGSLRLAKAGGSDPVVTELLLLDDTRTVYNVHAMNARPFDRSVCFEGLAPIFDRLVFSGPVGDEVRRSYELPAPSDGSVLWLAAFETDGCPAALSLPDSSLSDPALGTCSP